MFGIIFISSAQTIFASKRRYISLKDKSLNEKKIINIGWITNKFSIKEKIN